MDPKRVSQSSVVLVAAAMVLGLASGSGRAEEAPETKSHEAEPAAHEGEHAAHEGEHAAHEGGHAQHHPAWRLGLFGTGLASLNVGSDKSEWVASGGGGAFLKWAVTHYMVLGLVGHVLAVPAEHGIEIPVDLLVEFPIHLSHAVHPYLGLGPSFSALLYKEGEESKQRLSLGAAGVAGLEYWFVNQAALFVELNINWLYNLTDSEPQHAVQVGGTGGMLVAF